MRRQTYGYLPSRRASPPLDRYKIVLLGEQLAQGWKRNCRDSNPRTFESQIQRSNRYTGRPGRQKYAAVNSEYTSQYLSPAKTSRWSYEVRCRCDVSSADDHVRFRRHWRHCSLGSRSQRATWSPLSWCCWLHEPAQPTHRVRWRHGIYGHNTIATLWV